MENNYVVLYFLVGPELIRPGTALLYGARNQPFTLYCGLSVLSNPPAIVTWNDNFGRTVSIADPRFRRDSYLSLNVLELKLTDQGVWTCIITTEGLGVIRHSIELVVGKFVWLFVFNVLKIFVFLGTCSKISVNLE